MDELIEKDYNNLQENDIWTTDGLQIQFHALRGKDGEPCEDLEPDQADFFVPGYTIPDDFFD